MMQLIKAVLFTCVLLNGPVIQAAELFNRQPAGIYDTAVQLGPRPFFLVDDMDEGELKETLLACSQGPFYKTEFSIGHRGAPLQFPEHTRESYLAAARMGAGIMECDVTFTRDKQLVCRHSQCDLHTTTNILTFPELAEKCTVPPDYDSDRPFAEVQCCTSDITLAEFKQLQGKMDAGNPDATTLEDYLAATPSFRTDLYASKGTLMTHKESIELFKQLGLKMTPELKAPSVNMPFRGMTQKKYARKMLDEYVKAGVAPENVYPQSFNLDDVLFWIDQTPDFASQAVYLDGRYELDDFDINDPASWKPGMKELADMGVRIIAPPMWMLVEIGPDDNIVPSNYAIQAKAAGLQIITWTAERSGQLTEGGGWYFQTIADITDNDGDVMNLLDVLARDVGITGIFSDWSATVTYYANCMNLE